MRKGQRFKAAVGLAGIVTAAALCLSGCVPGLVANAEKNASHQTHKTPTPEPPLGGGSYGTVAALRDAFVKAGGTCPDWVENDIVTLAAQSGHCSDADVFSIYNSENAKDQAVATLKAISDGQPVSLLVGNNWIINAPYAPDYVKKLGGTVVTTQGSVS